jgi:hypothetical protein
MLGLCQRSGKFDFSAHREWYTGTPYNDDFTAHVTVRRKGTTHSVDWVYSVADARKARLWEKDGTWTTHPKRMLKYRARAFALRDAFPDVLMGLYTGEEMSDVEATIDGIDLTQSADDLREQLTKDSEPERPAVNPATPTEPSAAPPETEPGPADPALVARADRLGIPTVRLFRSHHVLKIATCKNERNLRALRDELQGLCDSESNPAPSGAAAAAAKVDAHAAHLLPDAAEPSTTEPPDK